MTLLVKNQSYYCIGDMGVLIHDLISWRFPEITLLPSLRARLDTEANQIYTI